MNGRESSDEALLGATPQDPEAFAAFYRRHLPAVLAFLLHRTRSPELAADLAAETFAVALGAVRRYDPAKGPGRAWLFGIAVNVLRDSARKGRVESTGRRALAIPPRELTDADLVRVEELADLERDGGVASALVAGLPEEQRAAVLARVVDDRDYAEIAAELRCSEAVVRQRVSRGLTRVRAALGGGR